MTDKLLALASEIVDRAVAAGAPIAEAVASQSQDLSAKVRKGEAELVEEAASRQVGVRVILGERSGTAYTSDTTPSGLALLVKDALEIAELSQPDPFALPPDPSLLAKTFPELDLFDQTAASLGAERAIQLAKEAEKAALNYDPRITNTEGATFSRSVGGYALVTSGGFKGAYNGTNFSISAEPVADDKDGKKQKDVYWDSKRFFNDLTDMETIGRESAKRTLALVGAQPIPTAEMPVVFSPDAARALLSLLLGCVSGSAIYRRASYLVDKEGAEIAAPEVTIEDDPFIPRGPGSRPFDGEGLPSRKNIVVEKGKLVSYLLDTYTGRKLNKPSTGNASRGAGGTPMVAATNFVLQKGTRDPKEILKEVDRGLYVTSMMGFGFNPATGDFSRGASGFLIEKGELTKPVSEVTVSAGFDELWKRIDAIGSDPDLRSRVITPTFRVKVMTVAGK